MGSRVYERLGKFLKKARKDAGLTQQEVAEKLQFQTAQYVSNWERGLSTPPLQVMATLVDIFHLDRELFLREILEVQKLQMQMQYQEKEKKITRLLRRKR